jgi:hypothetical protein
MNLILRPLDNVNDPVWSVIFMVFLSVCMALGYVIYLMRISYTELNDDLD